MRILHIAKTMPGTWTYFVEAPPERRNVFFSDWPLVRFYAEPLALPLPWLLYRVQGPPPGKEGPANVKAAYGRPGPIESPDDPLFFVPWPNIFAPGRHMGYMEFDFSDCGSIHISLAVTDPEELVSQTLGQWWGSPFRYMHAFLAPYEQCLEWLGFPPSVSSFYDGTFYTKHSIVDRFKRWEKLRLDEVVEFPWGKVPLPFPVGGAPGWK